MLFPNKRHMICSNADGQADATIDTTRTFYLGKTPSDDVKRAYTRVLQGHIALSSTSFPSGTDGDRLTMLAHEPLYR